MAPSMKTLMVLLLPLVAGQECPYAVNNKRDVLVARGDEPSLTTLASSFGKCARFSDAAGGGTRSRDWWPCQLRIDVLRQFSAEQNPYGADFDYPAAFAKLDYQGLKKDLKDLMRKSQAFWPADFGHYGGLLIRAAWHSAGTYRVGDGRGGAGMGQQRFAPLNSWPDNGNLDKARRLLWPIKQKYGKSISWADLLVLGGTVAMEDMGFPILGFSGGRVDTWQSDESVFWGAETTFVPQGNDVRYNGSTDFSARAGRLQQPLGASHHGLIYVNPEGPNANGDPLVSAQDIRMTFARMGMNDTETVALIAGGHAFGKTHGAVATTEGPPPEGASIELQGLGWKNPVGSGVAENAVTSGLEVIWSKTPTKWTNNYLNSLFNNTWSKVKSPAGAIQFEALNGALDYPDPFNGSFRRATMMVSDLALRMDPKYNVIAKSWVNDFDTLTTQFAAAWFKLTHRDLGPLSRYLGPEIPKQRFAFQDPIPVASGTPINAADQDALKKQILAAPGLTVQNLAAVAWGSASTYRGSDKRGGANGARIALQPQASWPVNNPKQLQQVLSSLKDIQTKFNAAKGNQVSLADLIILGGNAAVEKAAADAGATLKVAFSPGRVDATQADTDIENMENLNPQGDGFRNFRNTSGFAIARTEELLVDKAQLLTLTAPEMTALIGGMRAINVNFDGSNKGIFTKSPGKLTNDFFTNLLDINTIWTPDSTGELFTGTDRASGGQKFTATRADLVFGSHAELRALAEVYAQAGGQDQLVADFGKAWAKVANLDRFDLKAKPQSG